jgi:hypothetical protein
MSGGKPGPPHTDNLPKECELKLFCLGKECKVTEEKEKKDAFLFPYTSLCFLRLRTRSKRNKLPIDKFREVYILRKKADSRPPPDALAAVGTRSMLPAGKAANMRSQK